MHQPFEGRTTEEKLQDLKEVLSRYDSMAVALSGGVDSTLLAKVAHDVLGNSMIAITSASESAPHQDILESQKFCADEGIEQVVVSYSELDIPGFADNPTNRCYLCKQELLKQMDKVCQTRDIHTLAEGSNLDDEGDYRPGLMAIAERGAASPLREAHLTKQDVRDVSHMLNLKTWNKPQTACLSSRFPYWQKITQEKLEAVGEAEAYLHALGVQQCRVRIHDKLARIEVEAPDLLRLAQPDVRTGICKRFHELGFVYVTLDLDGFRSGSMNAVLQGDAHHTT
ncbi:MAG: ATP-dependent sacrificial sulfur transferase LarE [Atopobiaceae bacterium]